MTKYKATVEIFGDTIRIEWNGSVWVAPTSGAQFASMRDAMETELRVYYGYCGDDPDDPEIAAEIAGHLNEIEAA